jgi:hypothetical protein
MCGHEAYLRIFKIKTPNPCQNHDATLVVAILGQIRKKTQDMKLWWNGPSSRFKIF